MYCTIARCQYPSGSLPHPRHEFTGLQTASEPPPLQDCPMFQVLYESTYIGTCQTLAGRSVRKTTSIACQKTWTTRPSSGISGTVSKPSTFGSISFCLTQGTGGRTVHMTGNSTLWTPPSSLTSLSTRRTCILKMHPKFVGDILRLGRLSNASSDFGSCAVCPS